MGLDSWLRGYLDAGCSVLKAVHDWKQRIGEGLKEVDLYFAGPPLMAGAVEQEIVRHYRVPSDQVFYDRFG